MFRIQTLLGLLFCGFFLLGCEVKQSIKSPHWGKDTCSVCRMALTEPLHAAQLAGPGAQVRFYDDLGCAVNAILTQSAPAEAKLYVPKPGSPDVWVEASQTRFADGQKTPMDYGFSPAADGAFSIDQVIATLREKNGARWQVPTSAP